MGTAHEERYSEQDEREVGYSPRGEEAPSGAPTGKKSHKERIITVEARLDVLEASVEELYQGQQRLLGVESSQEEAESRIEKVESLIDQLIEDTKDSVRHLHEVVTELTTKGGCQRRTASTPTRGDGGGQLVMGNNVNKVFDGMLMFVRVTQEWVDEGEEEENSRRHHEYFQSIVYSVLE
ncbi:hypothetical protein B296_00038909 [Ensete ventricosum]|uniref:Uncharacterized protein n=1 Tax=Ensete ventricosum TaxID=4639 RepID=A0A426X7U7_ENSVE|nr:hypothetical protein B296_00038909 [Ensete ventricosum]